MINKTSSVQIETSESEILNENTAVEIGDGVVDTVETEKVLPEDVVSTKKKVSSSKKTVASSHKVKKTPVKRTSRTKIDKAESTPPPPVMKAFWGVFNQMMVQVAQYNYSDEDEAKKTAADMTEKKKAPHFVQIIKRVI